MRVRFAQNSDGKLQFIVNADNDAEGLVLQLFIKQVTEERFHLHGWTSNSDQVGTSSFNFGTRSPVSLFSNEEAHIIMGALNLCNSEGVNYIPPDAVRDIQAVENTLVQKLFNEHPLVVRDPRYASLESVKRATA